MSNILGLLSIVAAEADFYNLEENRGDSYLPFVGFMLFLIGFVVIFMGFSKFLTAKKNFNLFYDQRDSVKVDEATNQKNKNIGIVMMVAGLIVLVISFFVI